VVVPRRTTSGCLPRRLAPRAAETGLAARADTRDPSTANWLPKVSRFAIATGHSGRSHFMTTRHDLKESAR
jgi:hypothetical protein